MHRMRRPDYTEAWEENGTEALCRILVKASEKMMLVGTVLFARCGILGIVSRVAGKAVESGECLAAELLAGVGMVAAGVMIHVWAELREREDGE